MLQHPKILQTSSSHYAQYIHRVLTDECKPFFKNKNFKKSQVLGPSPKPRDLAALKMQVHNFIIDWYLQTSRF